MRIGDEFNQIFVASKIFGEQNQPRAAIVYAGLLVKTSTGCDISVYADNRFSIFFFTGLIKFNSSVKITIVGQSQSRHIIFLGGGNQVRDFRQGLKQRIMTVNM